MSPNSLWKKLCEFFVLTPSDWEISEGDVTEGAYKHSNSVLALSFSPDDTLLALAGGGCIRGADGSVRLIDVKTMKNVKTLHAHVGGVHDVCFDPQTGILASASFDYAVHLWNLNKPDVIFLRGEDGRTKSYSQFTRTGSLLGIGEYAYYPGQYSFAVYDLKARKLAFEFELPKKVGVTGLALSPDSAYMAVAACEKGHSAVSSYLYLVHLGTYKVVKEHRLEGMTLSSMEFAGGSQRLLAVVSGMSIKFLLSNASSRLVEFNPHTAEIVRETSLLGLGAELVSHPLQTEVAVADEGPTIRFYNPDDWSVAQEHPYSGRPGGVSSLAYSNDGNMLAYGMAGGEFDVLRRESSGKWRGSK